MNKYLNAYNEIKKMYDNFYDNAIKNHNGKNWKYQHLNDNVYRSLVDLHDNIIDNIIWKLFDENNDIYGFGMLEKFNNYNHKCFDECVSRLRGEKYDHEHDTLITLLCDTVEMGVMFQYCIKNGVSKNTAKSIKRHYEKINCGCYDHGWELFIVNKNYCTNYMDFEKSINHFRNDCFYENGVCVSEF